ncbi:hypothetical protein AMJ74_00190 [candidate division WOR_3 bacterium SM1_77]|uniref:Uncharacterized protein n=1 Tax=candidate division WOR_3 bacterium SM1_77 TaxID=1703778 RepID=A0A0S8K2D8_UNCW3|nr:MAG: hypothetical protein AMJ74_00190 [candidate division WOR_3 bacterium SM1_77]
MKRTLILGIAILIMAVVLSCGKKVMVPPRIDLKQYEVIGVIEFKSTSEGELGPYATKKFTEAMRMDQGMIRIVHLGSEADLLKSVDENWLTQAAFMALGERHKVSTILTGKLVVSDVRPDVTIKPGGGYVSFKAEVDATLSVEMIETGNGASIWNNIASATENVGHVSLFGGRTFAFDAKDPEEAYGKLINTLVDMTTKEFRVTWERKRD